MDGIQYLVNKIYESLQFDPDKDIKMDSLMLVRLIIAIEEECGTEIPLEMLNADQLQNRGYIESIVDYCISDKQIIESTVIDENKSC